jgi:hypothetical protein
MLRFRITSASLHISVRSRLTVGDLLDGTIIIHMNIETVWLEVHRAHAVGLEYAVLFGKVALRESLCNVALAVIIIASRGEVEIWRNVRSHHAGHRASCP